MLNEEREMKHGLQLSFCLTACLSATIAHAQGGVMNGT
jgi:hypothetical protein